PAPPALPPTVVRQAAAVEAHAAPILAKEKPVRPERRSARRIVRHASRHRRVIAHRVVHPQPMRSRIRRKARRK
ncbi:MAG: hypothetical protein ACREFB_12490, partial [Stellaceae bacterium]